MQSLIIVIFSAKLWFTIAPVFATEIECLAFSHIYAEYWLHRGAQVFNYKKCYPVNLIEDYY